MLALGKMERNDLAAARQYYAERGSITSVDFRILLRLQDDSGDELLEIAELERWIIVPTKY